MAEYLRSKCGALQCACRFPYLDPNFSKNMADLYPSYGLLYYKLSRIKFVYKILWMAFQVCILFYGLFSIYCLILVGLTKLQLMHIQNSVRAHLAKSFKLQSESTYNSFAVSLKSPSI